MKRSCRVLTILLFVIFLCQTDALAAQPELNYDQTELNEKVDAFIDEFGEKTVGANLSLFTAEEVLLERFIGFQDREADIPMGEETVVEWGSVTKLLTWISVMQMVEKGEIDLDEDIQTYLPAGFLTNLRYQGPLTMLHLMNHNAGFQEELVDIMVQDIGDVLPLEDALAKRKPAQVFMPGEFTAYSNWGTALAAFIVERVSGEDFADYVHNHIFEPLGMESTAIRPGLSDNAWVLGQRKKLSCYRENGALYPDSFLHIPLYPAGMATGTLGDFRLFAQSLLVQEGEGSPLFDRPQTFAFMVSPSSTFTGTEIPRNCHGFWFQDLGRNIIGHGGNTAGCTSHLLLDLEAGVGYVVMTNQQNETTYNIDLPKQLFGEFSESAYYDPDRELPKSMFYSARGIFEGPLKFSNVMLESMEEKDKTAL
ncbi:MAG: serine hydrolase domain-containing protein [Tissierellia bacterium]|nr:serine hydrolase domain-containing protein [Tissierellia bacterium]